MFWPVFVPGGGGVYIDNGNLRQAGGSIKIKASTSGDNGGGLLISKGSLVQADGQISCHKCSATRGGCLSLNGVDNYSLQTNGSIEAESCTATAGAGSQSFFVAQLWTQLCECFGGGALHISAGHWTSFGHIVFRRCRAKTKDGPGAASSVWSGSSTRLLAVAALCSSLPQIQGGAALVAGSIFQMKGTVTFASCTAAAEGAGMQVSQGCFPQPPARGMPHRFIPVRTYMHPPTFTHLG